MHNKALIYEHNVYVYMRICIHMKTSLIQYLDRNDDHSWVVTISRNDYDHPAFRSRSKIVFDQLCQPYATVFNFWLCNDSYVPGSEIFMITVNITLQ